jgi:ribonuclease BN (tRNA processing enzyme)
VSFVVTVLGSSGIHATADRACSSYLVEIDGKMLWLDAGAGAWQQLLQRIDHRTLDGIILTHGHPDHTSDVWQAVHAYRWGDDEPVSPIPLWATKECIDQLMAYATSLAEAFDLQTTSAGETISFAGAQISFFHMAHVPGTVGVRIEYGGKVFAYSADAGPESDIANLAASADIFVCEATYQGEDGKWEGHLTASEAAKLASSAGVGRLLLTHLKPGDDHERSLNEARDASDGPTVELAYDGLRLEVD